MKRIVCAAAAAAMVFLCFSIVSCSKPTLTGKWEMKVDGGTFALKGAQGSDDARFSGTVTTYVTFCEDGTYTLSADADSVAAFLRENLAAFIENATENAGRKMTVGEYMETAKVANEDALAALSSPRSPRTGRRANTRTRAGRSFFRNPEK